MKTVLRFLSAFLLFFFIITILNAQKNNKTKNLVYVDNQGVLRWIKKNSEASFFGVNYTAPFAYSYRALKALNVNLENAIRQDVYHMARLGLDAFRVHVWDTEITDSAGNLLENEHLRLFDFLLAELKKRNIKILITPIAFWGNGYPERDETTPGFSKKYGKGRATLNDTAIAAQENYLHQFFTHINLYTKLSYVNDPDVIAVELNNEPSHSGAKSGVTTYINRLAHAVRSTGFTKPLYYNIAQSPYYADAVAKSNIDGVSFQWYPTGLVANQEVQGNFLPNVDHYTIPFDTIPEYLNKSKMVYEFDAADVLQSNMYPAIARSFREAGFQWATQFAYDPLALAYVNTEYQTHYLNLAYTPSKAISLLIASEVFHKMPRLKNYGNYPEDSLFDPFRVSYKNNLSEMNTEQKFYYSNSTLTKPVNSNKLIGVAGVGKSVLVNYNGSGAYFLDKIEDGIWRLEIMPDAVYIRDPFERASPDKEVTRIQWNEYPIHIFLPDLGNDFTIKGLNDGNDYSANAAAESFTITPGTYLLTGKGKKISTSKYNVGVIGFNEFVAPKPYSTDIIVRHEPFTEISSGKSFTIKAIIVGVDASDKITLQINKFGGGFGQTRMIIMTANSPADYSAVVPGELATPGILNYRIIIQKENGDYFVFPGNHKGNPIAWDNYNNETWKTFVATESGRLEIFNPTIDRTARIYPGFKRGFQSEYITAERSGQLLLRLAANELSGDHIMGFQYFFADKLKGRTTENFERLFIRARTEEINPVKAKVTLINVDGCSVSTIITLTNTLQDIEVPLHNLIADSSILLPRPYPGFLQLKFKCITLMREFKLSEIEKIEVTIGSDVMPADFKKPYSMEVESIWIQKK